MKNKFFKFGILVLIGLTISSFTFAAAPGGVSANLKVWLKAEQNGDTTTNGGTVNNWDNLVGGSNADFTVHQGGPV